MKFKNLKLGNKLGIGFGFLILILLVASVTEFVSLIGIDKKNRAVIKSYDLADAFLESKNHALQDMQILMEIMESNSNDQLANWSNMHASASTDFESTLAKAKEIAGNMDWGVNFKKEKAEIRKSLVKVENLYEEEYLFKYGESEKIKTEILTANNQQLAELSSDLNRLDREINQSFNSLMKILADLEVKNQSIIQNSLKESKNQADQAKLMALAVLLIGISVIVIIGTIIIRTITQRLEKSVEFAKFINRKSHCET
jgi:CHASE3 domain sensor protein